VKNLDISKLLFTKLYENNNIQSINIIIKPI